jgi:serine/threonine protein kinase
MYEFMSNGSLSSSIFQDAKPGWKKRIQIAFGVARGLLYLREECSNQIIHCDIKPQNILLTTQGYLTLVWQSSCCWIRAKPILPSEGQKGMLHLNGSGTFPSL